MHLMIDLETLSTDPRAVVLSLGAVVFNHEDIHNTLYLELDIREQMEVYKRHVSADTLAWWMKQSSAARTVFSPQHPVLMHDAISQMIDMLSAVEWGGIHVWSNGGSFDIPIIHTMCTDTGVKLPWQYFNERCYRTLKNAFPNVKAVPMEGVEHNALNDALYQALHLRKLLECLPKDQR